MSVRDPNSFGNISQLRQKHIHIDLKVNFETSQLEGFVELQVECIEDSSELVLDTSALKISQVSIDSTELEVPEFFIIN
jgi:aminopeptidase N